MLTRGDRGGEEHPQPRRIVIVTRELELLGDVEDREREVALRVRRGGPHVVPEHLEAESLVPIGLRSLQVLGGVRAGTERVQPGAEGPGVEAVAPVLDDRSERLGDPGAAHDITLLQRRVDVLHAEVIHEERAHGEQP